MTRLLPLASHAILVRYHPRNFGSSWSTRVSRVFPKISKTNCHILQKDRTVTSYKKNHIYHIASHHVTSQHITSHHNTSHHITSYLCRFGTFHKWHISQDPTAQARCVMVERSSGPCLDIWSRRLGGRAVTMPMLPEVGISICPVVRRS